MNTIKYLLFFVLLSIESAYSLRIERHEEITSFSNFAWEKITNGPGTKMVFFDIDDTLVRKKLSLRQFFYENEEENLSKIIENTIDRNNLAHDWWPFIEWVQHSSFFRDRCLVEPEILGILNTLKEHKIMCFALTARKAKYAEQTEAELKKLGLDFSEISTYDNLELSLGQGLLLKNGVIYTGDKVSKAKTIPTLITSLGLRDSSTDAFLFDNSHREIFSFFSKGIFSHDDKNLRLTMWPVLYSAPSLSKTSLFQKALEEAKELYRSWEDSFESITEDSE